MPKSKEDPGPSVKDPEMYEALRDDGASKEKAARIANAAANSSRSEVGRRGGEVDDLDVGWRELTCPDAAAFALAASTETLGRAGVPSPSVCALAGAMPAMRARTGRLRERTGIGGLRQGTLPAPSSDSRARPSRVRAPVSDRGRRAFGTGMRRRAASFRAWRRGQRCGLPSSRVVPGLDRLSGRW